MYRPVSHCPTHVRPSHALDKNTGLSFARGEPGLRRMSKLFNLEVMALFQSAVECGPVSTISDHMLAYLPYYLLVGGLLAVPLSLCELSVALATIFPDVDA